MLDLHHLRISGELTISEPARRWVELMFRSMPGQSAAENSPPPTLAEYLTASFYDWEQRGRGWLLWDYPVVLEPPFVPFLGHAAPAYPSHFDDGRKPSILGAIAAALFGCSRTVASDEPSTVDIQEDSVPERSPQRFLQEIRIALPSDTIVTAHAAETFLRSLPVTGEALGFEIIDCPFPEC